MAGPVVDLQPTDALADFLLKLCRAPGANKVRTVGGAVDLTGARTKDDLDQLFRAYFRQHPRELTSIPGIDLPVCSGLIAFEADLPYLDASLTVRVSLRLAVGLILEDRAACRLTPGGEFYVPYLVTAVSVRSADRTPDRLYGPLRAALAECYGRIEGLRVTSADDETSWVRGPVDGDDTVVSGWVRRETRRPPGALEFRTRYFAGGVRERLKALDEKYQKHVRDVADK
jgi:hypothetical protein